MINQPFAVVPALHSVLFHFTHQVTSGYSIRGTQRQFSGNMCSEDDLRSRIFGTFVVKFLSLPTSPRIFERLQNGIIAHF